MDIQLTPPYRVDAVLTGEYVPPDEDNCVEMQCFDHGGMAGGGA